MEILNRSINTAKNGLNIIQFGSQLAYFHFVTLLDKGSLEYTLLSVSFLYDTLSPYLHRRIL